MIVKLEKPERAEALFEGCTDTTLFSCLQGVMGEVYGDDAERPEAARAVVRQALRVRAARKPPEKDAIRFFMRIPSFRFRRKGNALPAPFCYLNGGGGHSISRI